MAAVAALAGAVQAADFNVSSQSVDFDRWNYPFNGSPGVRNAAPTFGAVGNPGFDDRDGQFLIGLNSADLGVPTGLNPTDYQISSLTVTATHSTGSFLYDPTYDSALSADTDAGAPIVLTGAGLRNGFTDFTFGAGDATTFAENSPFQNGNAFVSTGPGVRHAFAAAFDGSGNLVDVSNNVRNGFDFTPWAVGTTDLNPGDAVAEAVPGVSPGSTFTFEVDLSDPDILAYVQQGLADGGLFFSVTSLTQTTQDNPGNPNFYTTNEFDPAAVDPSVSFDLTVVPEPASLTLVLGGGAMLLRRRTGRDAR